MTTHTLIEKLEARRKNLILPEWKRIGNIVLDEAIETVRQHYEGRPAVEGKPLELQTRDELLAYIREREDGQPDSNLPVLETREDENVTRQPVDGRAAFEAWRKKVTADPDYAEDFCGHSAWEGWKAALELYMDLEGIMAGGRPYYGKMAVKLGPYLRQPEREAVTPPEWLLASAQALLDLDAANALAPHGIGGHARGIIEEFIKLFADAPSEEQGRRGPDNAKEDG